MAHNIIPKEVILSGEDYNNLIHQVETSEKIITSLQKGVDVSDKRHYEVFEHLASLGVSFNGDNRSVQQSSYFRFSIGNKAKVIHSETGCQIMVE